jgi:ribosomal-protein-alanine N-acetyltransferase
LTRRGSIKIDAILQDLPTLETERLILRRTTSDDAEAVFDYASDPEVTRYVIWETHNSVEDSRAFLELAVSKRESGGEAGVGDRTRAITAS